MVHCWGESGDKQLTSFLPVLMSSSVMDSLHCAGMLNLHGCAAVGGQGSRAPLAVQDLDCCLPQWLIPQINNVASQATESA
jgi:hypothetical protein